MMRVARWVGVVGVAVLALLGGEAHAAATVVSAWSSQYASPTYPSSTTVSYSAPAGNSRVLLVAIATTQTAAGAIACTTPTYGATTLNVGPNDLASTATWNHTAIYYLPLGTSASASAQNLVLTCSGGTGYYTWVYAAVYGGVDQTTPLSNSQSVNAGGAGGTSIGPTNLVIGTNQTAFVLLNLARATASTTARTATWPATGAIWTALTSLVEPPTPASVATSGPTATLYIRQNGASGVTDNTAATASSTAWVSEAAISLKDAAANTPPSAPGNPTYTGVGATGLTVNWTDSTTGTTPITYTVGQSPTGLAGSFVNVTGCVNLPALTQTCAVSGLTQNTTYYYQVTATNVAGSATSATTSRLTLPTQPVMAPYTNVLGGSLTANWTMAAPTTGLTYVLQKGSSGTGPWTTVTGCTASATTCNVTGLSGSTTYWFQVQAVNATGSGAFAASTSVTTAAGPPPAPAAPSFTNITQTTLTVSWGAVTGATSYNVQRATDAAFTLNLTTFTGVTSPYNDTGPLTANTLYYYRAVAVNAQGSTNGASNSVTTLAAAPGAPGAPVFSNIGSSSVTVSWTAGTGATSYNLQRATDAAFTLNVTTSTGVTSPYGDTGLSASTLYYYRVFAVSSGGSTSGAALSVTTLANATLAVTAGTMPVGASYAAGTSGIIVGRIVLTATNSTATVSSISISNTGTAQAGADISTLGLFNDTSGAFLGAGVWNAVTSHWDVGLNVAVPVTPATTVRVVLGFNSGAAVGKTFIMNMTVPTDVTVFAPATVSNAVTIAGSATAFTVSAGTLSGSTLATAPSVQIINPVSGAVVSPGATGFKVQIRVFNAAGIAAITGVALSTTGAAPYSLAATKNVSAAYTNGTVGATYEVTVSGLAQGSYTLRAQAIGTATVVSEPVQILVAGTGKGDGNLLVRDNSSQLCGDCHNVQSHGSESVGTKYGAWSTTCRDCHTPHGTRNITLVSETITPPSIQTPQIARSVGFVKLTGDVTSGGRTTIVPTQPTPTASFTNSDNTGPCQVCHTRTSNTAGTVARYRNTSNADTHYTVAAGTQSCANCHDHTKGFAASCTGCHGTSGRTTFAAEAPPKDSCGNTVPGASIVAGTLNRVGQHQRHLLGGPLTSGVTLSNGVTCAQCHADPPNRLGHPDATLCTTSNTTNRAVFTWGTLATGALFGWSPTIVPTYSDATQACTNYCHGNFTNGKTTTPPTWNSTVLCGDCHGTGPTTPQPGGTHPTLTTGTNCNSCHPVGYNFTVGTACTTGCVDPVLHINGKMDADCTGCHRGAIAANASLKFPAGRRAITPEFTTAGNWSHKRNATPAGTVTQWDCIVCHMEGDPTTGDRSAVHGDGVINLRDPDTGLNITGVTFAAAGGTSPGSFSPTTSPATFSQFSRNLGVTLGADTNAATIEAIQINQCLKCHDSNGATAYAAGKPLNALIAQNGGSAGKPFGTTIAAGQGVYTGAGGYTACLTGTDGCVVNVAASFATTNSSYHPILGAQNNSYAAGTRMAVPWNITKTAGTTTSWGALMSCWDCHALPTDAGTITQTVTAHGGTATVRGNAFASGTSSSITSPVTFCIKCHAGYDTLSSSNHSTGSAFGGGGNSGMATAMKTACNMCHGGFWGAAGIYQVRPRRAEDVHGFNSLPPDGNVGARKTRWAGTATGTPATVNTLPYAFIRNTYVLGQHSPQSAVVAGVTVTYSVGCSTPTTNAASGCGSYSSYTVGGVF